MSERERIVEKQQYNGNEYPGNTSNTTNMIDVSCPKCASHWLVNQNADSFECKRCGNFTYLPKRVYESFIYLITLYP